MKNIRNVRSLATQFAAASLLWVALSTSNLFAQAPPPPPDTTVMNGSAGLWGLLGLLGLAGLLRRRSEHSSTYAAREQQPGMPRR